MKRWVLIAILIAVVILIVAGILIYKKVSAGKSIDFGFVDIGGELGGATKNKPF